MELSSVIDLEALLQPIGDESPVGTDLRESRAEAYYDIKDARNNARAAERESGQGVAGAEVADPRPHWRQVLSLAPAILEQESKDLEVACWYLEGLVREEGLAGLRDGVKLILGMVENFWDQGLFPQPDEDDSEEEAMETRVAPIAGLDGGDRDGTLIAPIVSFEVSEPGSGSGDFDCFTHGEYELAVDADKISSPDAKAERLQRLGYSRSDIEQSAGRSSVDFYVTSVDSLSTTLADYKKLGEVMRGHCGNDAPPTSNVTGKLESVISSLRSLGKDKLLMASSETEQTAEEGEVAAAPGGVAGVPSGVAAGSREEALNQLLQIARFFRSTEPHSPVAGGIERIVKWGRMPIEELMMELVPDETSRAVFSQLTGVDPGGFAGGDGGYVAPPPAPAAAPASAPATEDDWQEDNYTSSDDGW
jgi:type VI secretion system protein ImpA